MRVTPCGVHEQAALVRSYCLAKTLWALLEDDVSPTRLAWLADVERLLCRVINQRWHNDVALELRLANLTLDLAAIDNKIAEVCQQLLSTVLAADEGEECGSIVDEGRPAAAVDEGWVSEERSQEGDVRLDTTDTEFNL